MVLPVICRSYPRNLLLNRLAASGGRQVTPDERHALQRLAGVPHGVARSLMHAHGFTAEVIAGLVLSGLATVVPETARIGEHTIEVELVVITDAGRKAVGH
jgi:hypothetical protein